MSEATQHHAGSPSFVGREVLDRIFANQDAVQAIFDTEIGLAGVKAPACLAEVGTVLGYLDRMASCWWGCRQGDHLIEYLCGRAVSQTLAALRLMRFGLYDEALLACRGVGEIANLLFLFRMEASAFREWTEAPEGVRRNKFSPVAVRKRLDANCGVVPIDEHRYSRLSGFAAHVSPDTRPQAHNILGVPGVGIGFQLEGALICLNEIAFALSLATVSGSFILEYDDDLRNEIQNACRALTAQIGYYDLAGSIKAKSAIANDPELLERVFDLRRAFMAADKARRGKRNKRTAL